LVQYSELQKSYEYFVVTQVTMSEQWEEWGPRYNPTPVLLT